MHAMRSHDYWLGNSAIQKPNLREQVTQTWIKALERGPLKQRPCASAPSRADLNPTPLGRVRRAPSYGVSIPSADSESVR